MLQFWYSTARKLLVYRRPAVAAVECGITAFAIALAFYLRFDLGIPEAFRVHLWMALLISIPIKLAFSVAFGLHLYSFRYVSVQDVGRLMLVQFWVTVCSSLLTAAIATGFPRSIYFLSLLLSLILTAATRGFSLLISEFMNTRAGTLEFRNAVVYGAGAAGVSLLREIRNNPALQFGIKGFIDDQKGGKGLLIHGARVLGKGEDLLSIVRRYKIEVVLIAIPSASGTQMIQILENCRKAQVKSLTVPGIRSTIAGKGLAKQLRDVAVEDLLGRSPVRLEQEKIRARHAGRTVLVTGAAGSIGSELCRQIARFSPSQIVGLDTAESGLFDLQQELAVTHAEVEFKPAIGSIQNMQRLAEVFERYRPSIVYHAAAYKHVPLMEEHAFEAIENNVFGTLHVAVAAQRHGVEDFVMISSDKAVRPTNVMGATKRMSEMVIRSLNSGTTKFVSVRFGNVLGSNGSVVPMFKKQIAQGGPVTITHPDMRRYFMTIPEASQLVLQSATMGRGGEIFVLDMGEPVRIVDLANNLILLSGLKPDEDISIRFSGIRPGEKLYEELNADEENMVATYHEKIKIFEGQTQSWTSMERQLSRLQHLCFSRQFDELLIAIKEMVPEYNPSAGLIRKALKPKQEEYALSSIPVETIQ